MTKNIEVHWQGRCIPALLTTEHAASSYGLPVVVIDSEAFGPGDLLLRFPGCKVIDAHLANEETE